MECPLSLKYRISSLGWYNFELLVQTLLKAVIGPGVTSFGGSKDQGRDAEFIGNARFPTPEHQWGGRWVFQVKYIDFEEQGADDARSSLKSKFAKELRLVLSRHEPVNNYILVTDVPLTAQSRSALKALATTSGFAGNFASVDGKEVCQFLDMYGEIRKSYPQLLGLADLDVIINRDLYSRSQAYLQHWQPKLATYVQTEAHQKALSLLKKKHFIVLDGPPEAGKTTIAAALALIHATDGFEVIDVRASNDVFRASDEKSSDPGSEHKKRLFVADDAIGSISLVAAQADEWSRDLPGILRQLDSNRLLVWTARRYILEEALATSRLKEAAAEFPRPHEVLVDVGSLSTMQKAEILYNHAKQAGLSNEQRELVRTHAMQIINHPNFTPLRISQLFTLVLKPKVEDSQNMTAGWEQVRQFLKNPGERWIQAFRALSQSEQTLLSATLDFEGPVLSRALQASYELRVSKGGGRHLSFEECVSRLDHSFITVGSSHSGEIYVSVQHPSLRDMLLLNLRGDVDARGRYIGLATPFALAEIIGGIAERSETDTDPEHAVVPTNEEEFALFLKRLTEVSEGVPSLKEWELLLVACDRLIPQIPEEPEPTEDAAEMWRLFGHKPPTKKTEPVDLNLDEFGYSWKGKIIRALLVGFSDRRTMENGGQFGLEDWTRLLSRFYNLSSYLSPPVYPGFTRELCNALTDSVDSIRLANLINNAEPLVAKQRITRTLLDTWKQVVEAEAIELTGHGEAFGHGDDPDEFDEWQSNSKKLLSTVEDFARWGVADSLVAVEGLRSVLDSAERPFEPDPGDYEAARLPTSGPYWTIQRLFEDL